MAPGIAGGLHRSTRESEAAIKRHLAPTNDAPKPFVWTKTAAEMHQSAARLCRRTSGSGSSLSDGAEATQLRPIGIANELLDVELTQRSS